MAVDQYLVFKSIHLNNASDSTLKECINQKVQTILFEKILTHRMTHTIFNLFEVASTFSKIISKLILITVAILNFLLP